MKNLVALLALLTISATYCTENSPTPLHEKPEVYSWFACIESKLESLFRAYGFFSDEKKLPEQKGFTRKELEKQLRSINREISKQEAYCDTLLIRMVRSQEFITAQSLEKRLIDFEEEVRKLRIEEGKYKKKKNKKSINVQPSFLELRLVEMRREFKDAEDKIRNMVEYRERELRKQEIAKLKEKLQEILTLLEQCKE